MTLTPSVRRSVASSVSTSWQSAWAMSRAQRLTAARRVQPDRHEPGQRGGDQHAWRRTACCPAARRRAAVGRDRAGRAAPPRASAPAWMWSRQLTNEPVARRAITAIVDVGQRRQQLGDGRVALASSWRKRIGAQAGVSASSRPMRSSCPVAPPSANSVCLAARKYRCTGWSVSMPTPPCTCTVVCATRWPASAAQNAALSDLDVGGQVLGQPPRGLGQRQPQALDVDVAVGQSRRDGLEAADRPVELLALAGVLRGELQRALEHAELKGAAAQRGMGASASRATSLRRRPRGRRRPRRRCRSRCADAAVAGGVQRGDRHAGVVGGDEEDRGARTRFRRAPGRRRRPGRRRPACACRSAGSRHRRPVACTGPSPISPSSATVRIFSPLTAGAAQSLLQRRRIRTWPARRRPARPTPGRAPRRAGGRARPGWRPARARRNRRRPTIPAPRSTACRRR